MSSRSEGLGIMLGHHFFCLCKVNIQDICAYAVVCGIGDDGCAVGSPR